MYIRLSTGRYLVISYWTRRPPFRIRNAVFCLQERIKVVHVILRKRFLCKKSTNGIALPGNQAFRPTKNFLKYGHRYRPLASDCNHCALTYVTFPEDLT